MDVISSQGFGIAIDIELLARSALCTNDFATVQLRLERVTGEGWQMNENLVSGRGPCVDQQFDHIVETRAKEKFPFGMAIFV
ncbi:hypothetical protein WJ36_17515 [Burkholderia ubonensis]|nr:hypothetical protein WJ36_17515 [Burkholderia ubonensis]KWK60082.1 hypothetical protein WM15_14265 [Burkholderia ubonensis]